MSLVIWVCSRKSSVSRVEQNAIGLIGDGHITRRLESIFRDVTACSRASVYAPAYSFQELRPEASQERALVSSSRARSKGAENLTRRRCI